MAGNTNLGAAKKAKTDEFYTQWVDIEREMNAYLEFDPDVFRGKTVLLPCDDPEWSNFTKFFALHFADYGLKKLISTSYAPASNAGGSFYQPTLFGDPHFDESKDATRGKVFTLLPEDVNGDGRVDIDDLNWDYLKGDGDFRSPEVTALRDEADIVVTNPPFSLFREFVRWLVDGKVLFSSIGPQNAITYREIFPLIQHNRLWLGRGFSRGDAYFRIPESSRTGYADGVYDPQTNLVHFRNATWFTNIDHGRRHQPLHLMTMSDNLRYNKKIRALGYPEYHNFDAIEVCSTQAIPSDYAGVMGVPISFLDKLDPSQFEIVGMSRFTVTSGMSRQFVDDYHASGQTGQIHEGHPDVGYYDSNGRPVVPYRRIFIRHRHPEPSGATDEN